MTAAVDASAIVISATTFWILLSMFGCTLAVFFMAWRVAESRARALEADVLSQESRGRNYDTYAELDETHVFTLPRDDV